VTTGTIPVQAIFYGISTTAFDSAFAALDLYLNTTLKVFDFMAQTTAVTRTDWDTAWNDYYNA